MKFLARGTKIVKGSVGHVIVSLSPGSSTLTSSIVLTALNNLGLEMPPIVLLNESNLMKCEFRWLGCFSAQSYNSTFFGVVVSVL